MRLCQEGWNSRGHVSRRGCRGVRCGRVKWRGAVRSKPEAAESAEVSPRKPCQGPRLFFLRAMESL